MSASGRLLPDRLAGSAATLVVRRVRLIRLLGLAGWVPAAGVSVAFLFLAVLPPAYAAATGSFVGALAGRADDGRVLIGIGILIALAFAALASDVLRELLGTMLARRVDGAVRREVRRLACAPGYLTKLETGSFHDDALRATDAGQGIGRVRSPGTAAVGQLVLVFRFVSALAGGALLATLFPGLAGVLLVVSLVIRARLRRQWIGLVAVRDEDAAGQRRLAYLSDLAVVAGANELRIYGLANWLLRRRWALAHRVYGPTWRRMWHVLRSQKLVIALGTLSVATALAVPAVAALGGRIGAGGLVTSVAAAWTILSISTMGDEAFDIEYGLGGVRALDRLTARYGGAIALARFTVAEMPAAPPSPSTPPVVRFDEVSFGYGGGRPVLNGLSLTFQPGERIAVVGRNGAGKTTLIKLLAGLYPPTTGRITVAGHDLAELDPVAWRQRLAVVFQDFLRYPATVADNIAMSAPECLSDHAGIVAASIRAGAGDLVDTLPDGLRTSLWREGRSGTDLSGGQWQRIAIARALFAVAHGRQILVLDEPTAHLDVATETAFYQQVIDAVREVTVVLISHRLSTVRPVDRIILIRDGVVAEEGSHDALMSAGGEYHRMFTLQASRFTGGSARRAVPVGDAW